MKKINILTAGRFHVLDLARELQHNGYDVKFYSYVPSRRTYEFGLKKGSAENLLPYIFPFLLLEKLLGGNLFAKKLRVKALDFFTSILMRKSDVVIAMSGLFIKCLEKGKADGSIIIVERGSKHILDQKQILEKVPSLMGTKPVPDFDVARELKSYKLADFISVASRHVEQSFLNYNYRIEKIFINPYGVDLNNFYKIENYSKNYDVIFVGNWGYQKGCDLLVEVCHNLRLKLLHVGAIQDMPFPKNDLFLHIDPVDQNELVKYYNRAKVFCLPSRQEGLALVIPQAVACGLMAICSEHTGAQDIKEITGSKEILIMKSFDAECLKENLLNALHSPSCSEKIDLEQISWKSYGKRYDNFLKKIL